MVFSNYTCNKYISWEMLIFAWSKMLHMHVIKTQIIGLPFLFRMLWKWSLLPTQKRPLSFSNCQKSPDSDIFLLLKFRSVQVWLIFDVWDPNPLRTSLLCSRSSQSHVILVVLCDSGTSGCKGDYLSTCNDVSWGVLIFCGTAKL